MYPSPPKNAGEARAIPGTINTVMKHTNKTIRPKFTLRLSKSDLELGTKTRVMGIVNITPDSFSGDGLSGYPLGKIVDIAQKMIADGADIIDIGGESSRPNSRAISGEEEIQRVIPLIKILAKKLTAPISIDTYKPKVAQEALDNGASIVNDISGLRDSEMPKTIKKYGAAVILMHMKGTPANMQNNPQYESLIEQINQSLKDSVKIAISSGIAKNKIIIDPGIGFGKTVAHNLEIISRLYEFQKLNLPLLIGPSRKSFITNILTKNANSRLFGTAAAISVAITNGAHIVRVHDVAEIHDVVKITDAIMNANGK